MNILIFGDSVGRGKWDSEGGWVLRIDRQYEAQNLQQLAVTKEYPDVIDTYNLSIAGEKSEHMKQRIADEIKARDSSRGLIIVVAIGLNDTRLTDDKPHATPEEFAQNLGVILRVAREHTAKVLCVGLTPVDETKTNPVPYDQLHKQVLKNDRILQFEQGLRAVCAQQEVAMVSLFESFQAWMQTDELFVDGVHPNDKGHKLIAGCIKPRLDQMLRKQD